MAQTGAALELPAVREGDDCQEVGEHLCARARAPPVLQGHRGDLLLSNQYFCIALSTHG